MKMDKHCRVKRGMFGMIKLNNETLDEALNRRFNGEPIPIDCGLYIQIFIARVVCKPNDVFYFYSGRYMSDHIEMILVGIKPKLYNWNITPELKHVLGVPEFAYLGPSDPEIFKLLQPTDCDSKGQWLVFGVSNSEDGYYTFQG